MGSAAAGARPNARQAVARTPLTVAIEERPEFDRVERPDRGRRVFCFLPAAIAGRSFLRAHRHTRCSQALAQDAFAWSHCICFFLPSVRTFQALAQAALAYSN